MRKGLSIFLAVVLVFLCSTHVAAQEHFSKADYAKLFCEILEITPFDDDINPAEIIFNDLREKNSPNWQYLSAMKYALPGATWDGKKWEANGDEAVTEEMILKSFVIFKSYKLLPVVDARRTIAQHITMDKLREYGYSEDIDMYLGTLLDLGWKSEKIHPNTNVDAETARERLTELRDFKASSLNSESNTMLRGGGVTVSNYDLNDAQEYYMDGPIVNANRILNRVEEGSKLHQYTGLKVDTVMNATDVGYGIGAWANALSTVEGSKVDGLFVTVGGKGEGVNSQLIGQEIDVMNERDPETEEQYTTAGLQIVTIGTADSTAAIEIVSDWSSKWRHGIMLDEKAISEDGTVLAVGQKVPMKMGIDFSQCSFTDSAIRLNNNQLIRFQADSFEKNGSIMYMTEDNFFVLTSGPNGFAVKDNNGIENLLVLDNSGKLDENCLVYKNYFQQMSQMQKDNRNILLLFIGISAVFLVIVLIQGVQLQKMKKGIQLNSETHQV